ncbi:hypothetical protein COX08_02105 [Candidatus Beckwithbacteria bacterium CG23_combo_of_CG06-09_8_20_14_all_34_8]|uniref:Membrane protein 6-pyruvoyl-tetrahydropterin synthase-related domain-containing protein n=1 Tax=Candidatus Beckwithbacteria bacterium CG23_combo_of_CG06-09_8_20_14_all_34_8 TaxID=1974497 RepID=A0A2H0B6J6_9BACT|nr:MAG: hypothetical protein COX08_02105 [Candidatus Beckwithbacteria bacterium CG23_combo_of_CG06-09_8_20_14_all_34_8]
MKIINIYWPLFILVVAIILLNRTLLSQGIPDTHDGNSHVARIANYYLAFRDGHFPIRWAPNLNYKYGYPVFQYHYQTPYFAAVLFYKIGFTLEQSYKLVYFIFSILAALTMFWWLKQHLSKLPALIGTLLYISAPPFIYQIFVRGAFGEFVAWCLLPLLFLCVNKFSISAQNKRFDILWFILGTISTALLVISHIMLTTFGLTFVFIYGLILDSSNNIKKFMVYVAMFLLGLGLSAFFLLPAILESKFVTFSSVALTKSFTDHFLYLSQFFYSPWDYGYSVAGPKDTMSFMLGFASIFLVLILFIYLTIQFKFKKSTLLEFIKKEKLILYFLFFTLLSIFFMTNASVDIWNLFHYLWKIQFPWRLLVIPTFSLATLGAITVSKINNQYLNYIVLVICFVQIFLYAKPGKIMHLTDYEYFEFPFTSSVNNELLPNDFNMYRNIAYTFQVKDINNLAKINIENWITTKHRYSVESTASANIVERLAYMPGWETTVDGKITNINTRNPDYPGLPNFELKPGKHLVETTLTENTFAKKTGDYITLFSFSILLIISLVGIKNRYVK